jgi:methenyltetrahydromethanopterin cyclohydrolase
MKLNSLAANLCRLAIDRKDRLRVTVQTMGCGTQVIDFGVHVAGGISAGVLLAKICLADRANVELMPADPSIWMGPQILVSTDEPLLACMASQYAGWPVQADKFFAMGSGPMRTKRGRESILDVLKIHDESTEAVGVLECDQLPDDSVCRMVASECGVPCDELILCVAPTRSIAGTIQVVARSIETSLHKLFELGFDLRQVISGHGSAPLPPPARDFTEGIGRSNDAILYGGRVTLWVDEEDSRIDALGPKVPSGHSKDWGRPFADVFREYNHDFYKVDPGLFSPAEVTFNNLGTGRTRQFGSLRPDVVKKSFGCV